MPAVRTVIVLAVVGCSAAPMPATPATPAMQPLPKPQPAAASVPMSDPFEYEIKKVSRDAGKAIFTRTGIGDPYRTGVPYPIFLALERAFPETFGASTQ